MTDWGSLALISAGSFLKDPGFLALLVEGPVSPKPEPLNPIPDGPGLLLLSESEVEAPVLLVTKVAFNL